MNRTALVIAVDGPAASGKGTIARALAAHFNVPHFDTGLLYRAVGAAVAARGLDPADPRAAEATALDLHPDWLNDATLRSDRSSSLASIVSAHPGVRAALLERQRRFAAQASGAVLDGRDIGTVIAPDARAKLFVDAPLMVRATRRWNEMGGDFDAVLADLSERDARDRNRPVAPLRPAYDADLLDTGQLTIGEAVHRAIALVEARITAGH